VQTKSLFKFPRLAAHRTVGFRPLLLNPLQDAVQVKNVVAFAPNWQKEG